MDGVLSQEEINALLNDPGSAAAPSTASASEEALTDSEKTPSGKLPISVWELLQQRCFHW